MSRHLTLTSYLLGTVAAVLFSVQGCAPTPPAQPASTATANQATHGHGHDHDEHGHDHDEGAHAAPASMEFALEDLKELCASVKKSLADGNVKGADVYVHKVGHLVEDIRKFVDSGKFSEDVKVAKNKALDEIFDCFDKLDAAIHSGDEEVRKKIDYLKHEPQIEESINELQKTAKAVKEEITEAAGAVKEEVKKAAEAVKEEVS
ncbi:MAG: hypothetical protein KAT44_11370, partial [Pirellulales bacterium]|nr:hypothetical protein [Pirellulales bacterium]